MIIFKSVTCIYDDGTRAIDDISLRIRPGEFCVLLGPSGAGKSTLINMTNGLVSPNAGSVMLDGIEFNKKNKPKIQRRIGMVHQQLHLVSRLSVLHNVLAGLLLETGFWRSLIKSFPGEYQKRAHQLLYEVGLDEKHLWRRVSSLSVGQQQRVAIARALISRPQVVMADEPIASLDPSSSRGVLNILKTAAKNCNTTVICALHQPEFAIEFADRIIGLREGKLYFDGRPAELDKETQMQLYGHY